MESSQPNISPGRRRDTSGPNIIQMAVDPACLCLMLAAVIFWLYSPAIRFGFTHYDDLEYFAQNPHVQAGLGWDGMLWAFRSAVVSNWHPLTMLSFMLDATMAGTLDPSVPHFTNILLHAINSVLLFLLLQYLTGAKWRSLFVAGLFALHPLNVESVVWISERKNVLSTCFWLLTIFAYARYVHGVTSGTCQGTRTESLLSRVTCHVSRFYVLALLFFALGLMSKPMLVTLPFVLLLLDDWPWERWRMTSVREWRVRLPGLAWEKAPFFILSVLSCAVTLLVQQHGEAMKFMGRFPLGGRIENVFVSYPRYLCKTCWPVNLAVLYPHPGHWPPLTVAVAATFILAASYVVIGPGKKYQYLYTGWFWFLGTLIPVIGLIQVGGQSMADRYAYVPLIGIFIMASWGAFQILQGLKFPRMAMFAAAGIILVASACQSRKQLNYWQNDEILFRHVLAITKNNVVAHVMLGANLADAGKLEEAIKHYQEALAIAPDDMFASHVHYDLGNALSGAGQFAEAEKEYRIALRIDPNLFQAHYNLGILLGSLGRREEAIEQITIAVRLKPELPDWRQRLQALGVSPH
jgi:protein O-mannosyl-transferase